jgi:hypothetical protein
MLAGGCHCGAIRYEVWGEPVYHALCHCSDCRRQTGAPVVSWALFPNDKLTIAGTPSAYASSEHARRHFCGTCGSSLFYTNAVVFPGLTDICSATLDEPDSLALGIHVQTAERIGWMKDAHTLPQFERYPPQP